MFWKDDLDDENLVVGLDEHPSVIAVYDFFDALETISVVFLILLTGHDGLVDHMDGTFVVVVALDGYHSLDFA